MCRKIMVVEEESSIREALSKVLTEENYEVLSASSGREAVAIFGSGRIDLLLLDLGLPVKDGPRVLEWLRKINPLPPLVVITVGNNHQQLAEAAGADVSMQKPLNVPLLLNTIRELIEERMAGRDPGSGRRPDDGRRPPEGGGGLCAMPSARAGTLSPGPKFQSR